MGAGRHVVAAVLTQEFLDFTRLRGNDLQTPRPDYDFPASNRVTAGVCARSAGKEANRPGSRHPSC